MPSPRRTLTTLFLIVFTDLVGFGIVIPLLPLYAEHFGPAPWVFGLLMASYSAMQFIFSPILGRISDRVGRRPVLLISIAGSVAGFVLFDQTSSSIVMMTPCITRTKKSQTSTAPSSAGTKSTLAAVTLFK